MPSTDHFLPDGDAADEVEIEVVTEAGFVADFDGPARRGFDGRADDVLLPVALAGGDVAGEDEIGERGQCDVVGASDAGFEHATAPDGDAGSLGDVVDL